MPGRMVRRARGSFSVNAKLPTTTFDMWRSRKFEIRKFIQIQECGYAGERPHRVKSRLEPLDGGPRSSEPHLFFLPSALNGILVRPSLTSKAYSRIFIRVSRDANWCSLLRPRVGWSRHQLEDPNGSCVPDDFYIVAPAKSSATHPTIFSTSLYNLSLK